MHKNGAWYKIAEIEAN